MKFKPSKKKLIYFSDKLKENGYISEEERARINSKIIFDRTKRGSGWMVHLLWIPIFGTGFMFVGHLLFMNSESAFIWFGLFVISIAVKLLLKIR